MTSVMKKVVAERDNLKEDMKIVCERWTTSKLCRFEDLQTIGTYGFRGEALCSVSHIAHVTIVSMVRGCSSAYRATYRDGKLCEDQKGSPEPKPCAGIPGTQIIVEDLFYNYPLRKRAFSASEEYHRIYDVVSKYAIHNAGIAFNLKKLGENRADIATKKVNSIKDNIREQYGSSLVKELVQIELEEARPFHYRVFGFISNGNLQAKKSEFILFVNHRLVECPALKKSIKAQYSTVFSKAPSAWTYLSVELDSRYVDVNVHPTKREVRIQDDRVVFGRIMECIGAELDVIGMTRAFAQDRAGSRLATSEAICYSRSSANGKNGVVPWEIDRSESRTRSMNAFLGPLERPKSVRDCEVESFECLDVDLNGLEQGLELQRLASETSSEWKDVSSKKRARELLDEGGSQRTSSVQRMYKPVRIKPRESPSLLSVKELLSEAERTSHVGLKALFHDCAFVGCVSPRHALVQYKTQLFMCDMHELSKELFYQECLHRLGELTPIELTEPAPIVELVKIALTFPEANWDPLDGDPDDIGRAIQKSLISKKDLMEDYYSVQISSDGYIKTLPEVIDGLVPFAMDGLAMFVLRLYTEVGWIEEKESLERIARELALLYALPDYAEDEDGQIDHQMAWSVEHQLLPSLRVRFMPPTAFVNSGAVRLVTKLSKLYRVFERC
ncbi:DNA mismatch repair protein Mlh1-like isoform X2 [Schistocerca gregaria]|uniref:DNA mismatch repair protein Mlh1-like isoform X2 n=1 Tax=Schistocerca gregaria TaxID=7010 RepID=UPI00211DDCBC|nr:DNA mismatch repair protein Mlh1-like isoform X2 [Schistocerca gregaria]